MTNEIPRQEWKQFCDSISKNYLEWQTRVEVLKDDLGAQVLSDGLPLIGFMFEEKANKEQSAVEIMLGEESGAHQTHTIFNPQNIFFDKSEDSSNATLEIEDKRGGKILVYLIQPIQVLAAYPKPELLALA